MLLRTRHLRPSACTRLVSDCSRLTLLAVVVRELLQLQRQPRVPQLLYHLMLQLFLPRLPLLRHTTRTERNKILTATMDLPEEPTMRLLSSHVSKRQCSSHTTRMHHQCRRFHKWRLRLLLDRMDRMTLHPSNSQWFHKTMLMLLNNPWCLLRRLRSRMLMGCSSSSNSRRLFHRRLPSVLKVAGTMCRPWLVRQRGLHLL